jgi:hypothetical protein
MKLLEQRLKKPSSCTSIVIVNFLIYASASRNVVNSTDAPARTERVSKTLTWINRILGLKYDITSINNRYIVSIMNKLRNEQLDITQR